MSSSTRSKSKRFEIPETGPAQNGQDKNGQDGLKKQAAAPTKAQSAPAVPAKAASSETHLSGTGLETSFHYDAPSAKTVLLAGEFTQWDKNPVHLIKGGGGVWHAKVALPPGRHHYRFLVDGEWQNDPVRHERVPNAFGSFNNVVEIK